MIEYKERYIQMKADKRPQGRYADQPGHSKEEAANWKHAAIMTKWLGDVVIIDFDEPEHTEEIQTTILAICTRLQVRCRLMQTDRGLHLWLRDPRKIWPKNQTKQYTALGLQVDIRRGGINGYAIVRRNGIDREWLLYEEDLSQLDEVPTWLYPVHINRQIFQSPLGMKEGNGRNNWLLEHQLRLAGIGLTEDQIWEASKLINDYVFRDALSPREFDTVTRDDAILAAIEKAQPESRPLSIPTESGKPLEGIFFNSKGVFQPNVFGDAFIAAHHTVVINGLIYHYRSGCYLEDDGYLRKFMTTHMKILLNKDRNEVESYVRDHARVIGYNERDKEPFMVNVRNGRLNLLTSTLTPHTPDALDFAQINAEWIPGATSMVLDQTLDKVFPEDPEAQLLFEEIVGYTLIKSLMYRKSFIFHGSGQNGKSSILNMLKAFLGAGNYSVLSLAQLESRFGPSVLENKLANIGDDIGMGYIEETEAFKKLTTGESLLVERKGENAYELRSYATQIFAANHIPTSRDKTEGFMSRIVILPFTAQFEPGDPGYDPMIEQKLTSNECLNALLVRAVAGLQRLYKNAGQFTSPESARAAMYDYRVSTSQFLSWVEDEDIYLDHILDKTAEEVYTGFRSWAQSSGIRSELTKLTFSKELRERFGVQMKTIRTGETTKKVYKQIEATSLNKFNKILSFR